MVSLNYMHTNSYWNCTAAISHSIVESRLCMCVCGWVQRDTENCQTNQYVGMNNDWAGLYHSNFNHFHCLASEVSMRLQYIEFTWHGQPKCSYFEQNYHFPLDWSFYRRRWEDVTRSTRFFVPILLWICSIRLMIQYKWLDFRQVSTELPGPHINTYMPR